MRRIQAIFSGRIWAALLSGSLIGVLIFAVAMIWRGARGETIVLEVLPVDDPNIVRVYVGGEVATPGLYSLPRGSRVSEALDAAGGTTASGDPSGFSMAEPLEDADQIIVPARRVQPSATAIPPVAGASGVETPVRTTTVPEAPSRPSLIDINTATAAELETLPGIGPALAARIIEHRSVNGPFASVDELEDIRGISARMVDEMRHLLTTGT